jgi:hypothetical protein
MTMHSAFYWLNRAEMARAMAEDMPDPLAKQTMMEIVALYEKLAGHIRTLQKHSHEPANQPAQTTV